MGVGDLKLMELGKVIAGIIQDLSQFDNRIKVLEDQAQIGADPPLPQAGFANVLSPLATFPVKVTEVNSAECYFSGRMITASGTDCSPWTVDTLISSPIRVDVSSGSALPAVDEHVPAIFLGTFSESFVPRYGYFPQRTSIFGWYKLASHLGSGGYATANIVQWNTSSYTVTSSVTTVQDFTGMKWGITGEMLLCGPTPGGVIEVLVSGKEEHVVTLAADLLTGGSAASSLTINGVTSVVTVYDHADLGMAASKKIASGGKVRIWYETEDEKWYADWAKCSAVVAQ